MAAFRKLRESLGLRRRRLSRHVHIGRHTYGIGPDTVANPTAESPVRFGNFCSIAAGVQIHGSTHHPMDRVTTYPLKALLMGEAEPGLAKGGVVIGHGVWIGARAIILSNLSIGNGAVIGSGAVVTKDVPAYAIVAGNPARQLRFRFDADTIAALERIAWWLWPDEKIRAEIDLFYGSVDAFIARHDGPATTRTPA